MKSEYVKLVKEILNEQTDDELFPEDVLVKEIDSEENLEGGDEAPEEQPEATEEQPEDEEFVISFEEAEKYYIIKKMQRKGQEFSLTSEIESDIQKTEEKLQNLEEKKLLNNFMDISEEQHTRAFEKYKMDGYPEGKSVHDYYTGGVKVEGKNLTKVDEVVETVKEIEIPTNTTEEPELDEGI